LGRCNGERFLIWWVRARQRQSACHQSGQHRQCARVRAGWFCRSKKGRLGWEATWRNVVRGTPPDLPGGERLLLSMPDGDTGWRLGSIGGPTPLPGRLSCSCMASQALRRPGCVVTSMRHLVGQGWPVLRLNLRGTLPSLPTAAGHYHAGRTIKELNTPLPRGGLIFSMLASFGRVYPAWPLLTGYTHGLFHWQSRAAVSDDLKELNTMRAAMNEKIAVASLAEIEKTPELLSFARAEGGAAFAINCSPCHGAGGQGSKGYPNLNADRWIWGGTLEAIQTTIMHGAR
jgi:cytochrome c553